MIRKIKEGEFFPEGWEEVVKYKQTPDGQPTKYRSMVIDTLSAYQNKLYDDMMRGKKGTHDEWKDFGMEAYGLAKDISRLPDTVVVFVLGLEGTGKTMGVKALDPDTNVYNNADRKPMSFFGANRLYPTDNSRKNYAEIEDYRETFNLVKKLHEKRRGTFIVFLLGHTDTYNSSEGWRERLRVLGKQATKLGIEGLNTVHTYYTKIETTKDVKDASRYQLMPFNSGFNTARSPEGYWDGNIPNNYQIIVNRILEDKGEIVEKKS